jgi:hypothetical protein
MISERELKALLLDYAEKFDENNIKLVVNIDKAKKSAKINKELFDT